MVAGVGGGDDLVAHSVGAHGLGSERGGADQAGVVAQRRGRDLGDGAVAPAGELAAVGGPYGGAGGGLKVCRWPGPAGAVLLG